MSNFPGIWINETFPTSVHYFSKASFKLDQEDHQSVVEQNS